MHIPTGMNLIVILAVVLLVFGPDKLPSVARSMAKAMAEFRGAMREVTGHLDFNSHLNATSNETRVYSASNPPLGDGHYDGSAPGTSHSYHSDPYHSDPYHSDPHYSDSHYPDHYAPESQPDSTGHDFGGAPTEPENTASTGSTGTAANNSMLIG